MPTNIAPSPAAVAEHFTAIETAAGWHQLRTTDGRTLAAQCQIVGDAVVQVAIPAECHPHPAIASALRAHVVDVTDDGSSPTIARYLARNAAGAWRVSDDNTECVLSLHP